MANSDQHKFYFDEPILVDVNSQRNHLYLIQDYKFSVSLQRMTQTDIKIEISKIQSHHSHASYLYQMLLLIHVC